MGLKWKMCVNCTVRLIIWNSGMEKIDPTVVECTLFGKYALNTAVISNIYVTKFFPLKCLNALCTLATWVNRGFKCLIYASVHICNISCSYCSFQSLSFSLFCSWKFFLFHVLYCLCYLCWFGLDSAITAIKTCFFLSNNFEISSSNCALSCFNP
jgi:hypothetical protein